MTVLNEELSHLIEELREIEARITELTGNTVDTVIDRQGMPFLLSQAQYELNKRAEIHRQYAELQSAILNALPANITVLDSEGQLVNVNNGWRDFAEKNGYPDELFGVGQNYLKTCDSASGKDAEYAKQAALGIRSVLQGAKSSFSMEYPCHSPWKQRWFRLTVTPLHSDDQRGAVVMHLDITERKLADLEMQRALSVFKSSNNGILVTDADMVALDVNPAYSEITGYDKEDIIGQKTEFIINKLQSDRLDREIKRSLKTKGYWCGEVRNRKKSGEVYIENLTISVVHDSQGELKNYVIIFSDITQSKTHEAELDHVANHDPLTGLPNRRLLTDRLQTAVLRCKRDKDLLALCFLDLDDFKPVNDKLGHEIGDRVLIEISNRLKSALRESDTVSRIGGDEFVLVLPSFKNKTELISLLDRLIVELVETLFIDEHKIQVTASIGVVLFPDDNVDADTLLRHADQAMYVAKESGRNQYHIYNSRLVREIESRNNLVDEIKNSLNTHDFVLYYQPKVNFITGTVIGFEALVRWQHPTKGLLSPMEFLPAIIGSSIETQFGDYVMRCAIEQLNEWQKAGHKLQLSINVSANELRQTNLISKIDNLLQEFPAVRAQQLEIEVLETAAVDDITEVNSNLTQCRNLGIQVSLDDFGTGYSSLTIFRQLPVDIMKIDQSFVRNMLNNDSDRHIVESVVSMAKAFDRGIIAEGVETQLHAAKLIEIGCDFGQGYGIAKPMPASNVLDWLAQSQPRFSWQN